MKGYLILGYSELLVEAWRRRGVFMKRAHVLFRTDDHHTASDSTGQPGAIRTFSLGLLYEAVFYESFSEMVGEERERESSELGFPFYSVVSQEWATIMTMSFFCPPYYIAKEMKANPPEKSKGSVGFEFDFRMPFYIERGRRPRGLALKFFRSGNPLELPGIRPSCSPPPVFPPPH